MDILIIGVGNAFRSDDGAGLTVIDMLRARNIPSAQLLKCESDCSNLLDAWQNAETVIVIDAVSSGAPPGTLYRFDALAQPLPRELSFHSTHIFGVAEAIALGRILGQLPASLFLYAIEGKTFTTGVGLFREVALAAWEVASRVEREVRLYQAKL